MIKTFEFLGKYIDFGLLAFRIVLGGMYMWHGWPKMIGGPERWAALGQIMANFGITFFPTFWGFMAAFGEFGGGIMILLGFFYRIGAFLLFFTMFTAFTTQMMTGKGLSKASQSFENGFSFFAAMFVGPGKYSIDHHLLNKKSESQPD